MANCRTWILVIAIAPVLVGSGCAALTNPVADGIPVRRLPAEVLGRPKSDLKPIPLTVLRQREQTIYTLDKGDTLAIIAEKILGDDNAQPPVRLPDGNNGIASVGFPVPVNEDGKISLPRLPLIDVKGKTLSEVEKLIFDTASGKNGGLELINPKNPPRISVQLLQKRFYTITVERQDAIAYTPQTTAQSGPALGSNKKGNSFTIKLPAGENDVLHALSATGGLPGLDAKNEVLVERGVYDPNEPGKSRTRIPLRVYPEQALDICEADIILKDGDVVRIESRDTDADLYYTVGVAGSRQFTLPRDYDLDVLQALVVAGAPIANGGFTQNAFVASAVNSGLGSPSPSLVTILRPVGNGRQIPIRVEMQAALRDPRERIRILAGDIIVLQERPGDAAARYLTQTIRFNNAAETIRSGSFTQNATGSFP
jgi:protein involved in polysaccharide export with SLBB domain